MDQLVHLMILNMMIDYLSFMFNKILNLIIYHGLKFTKISRSDQQKVVVSTLPQDGNNLCYLCSRLWSGWEFLFNMLPRTLLDRWGE